MSSLPWGRLTGIRPAKIARKLFESGLDRAEVEKVFLEKYQTDPLRSRLATEVAQKEAGFIDNMTENGISLYIGIPFCPSRCAYCSFISFSVEKSASLMEPYLECLFKEIEETASIIRDLGKIPETVYIGGGTPTTLSAKQLSILIEHLYKSFDLSSIKEFSVEAGRADTITADRMRALKSGGVSRISINAQSMFDSVLETIGRKHTVSDIYNAFDTAKMCGMDNINTDIIAGLPGETVEMFCQGLNQISDLSPNDITVHTMSLKRASVINQNIDGYSITEGEAVGEMLDYASKKLSISGFHPYYLYRQKNILGGYENTGFSKPGFECLYNIYIMEEVQSIIAMGCGGSTKLITEDDIERNFNVKEPTEYIKRIDEMILRKQNFLSQFKF